MERDENHSFNVKFITTTKKPQMNNKAVRTSYLWASIVIVDDEDCYCPVIEG